MVWSTRGLSCMCNVRCIQVSHNCWPHYISQGPWCCAVTDMSSLFVHCCVSDINIGRCDKLVPVRYMVWWQILLSRENLRSLPSSPTDSTKEVRWDMKCLHSCSKTPGTLEFCNTYVCHWNSILHTINITSKGSCPVIRCLLICDNLTPLRAYLHGHLPMK